MIYFTSIKIKYSSKKECIFFLSNIDLKSMMKTSCSILPSCMMTRSGLCEWHNWKFLTEACNIGTLSQCTVWNYRVIFVISQCPTSSDQSSQIEAPLTTFVKVTIVVGQTNWPPPLAYCASLSGGGDTRDNTTPVCHQRAQHTSI